MFRRNIFSLVDQIYIVSYFRILTNFFPFITKIIKNIWIVKAKGVETTCFPTLINWLSVTTNRITLLDKPGDFNPLSGDRRKQTNCKYLLLSESLPSAIG